MGSTEKSNQNNIDDTDSVNSAPIPLSSSLQPTPTLLQCGMCRCPTNLTQFVQAIGQLLPHLFLLLVSLGYTCLGAYIFLRLEKPYWDRLRNETRHNLEAFQSQLTDNLWRLTRNSSLSPADGVVEFEKCKKRR